MDHVRILHGHNGAVLRVRYTRDGTYCMSCGADRKIMLWNPARAAEKTGALLIKEYSGPHGKEVASVAIAKDCARFASCGGDAKAFVWDVSTGSVLKRLEGHGGRVNAVEFAAIDEAVLATAAYDNTVRLWDLRSQSRAAIQTINDFRDSVTSLAVGRDDKLDWGLLAASVDGTIRRYDIRRGMLTVDDFGSPVTSVALSGDGACIAASCLDSSVRLLELVTPGVVAIRYPSSWQAQATGSQLNLYKGHVHTNYSLESCLSHDDAFVASCMSPGHIANVIFSIGHSSRGAGSEDGRVVIWRLVEANVAFELRGIHKCVDLIQPSVQAQDYDALLSQERDVIHLLESKERERHGRLIRRHAFTVGVTSIRASMK